MDAARYKCAKGGVGTLLSVLRLTTNEGPCHVYSKAMPSKQTMEQTNNVHHSRWQLQSQVLMAHNTLNGTMTP